MNKKINISIIVIGLIFITVSLFVMAVERKYFFEIEMTNELKEKLDERIDIMTSDYYCNNKNNDLEKTNCIYYVDNMDGAIYSNSDELYYLILSNMKHAKKIEYDENMEFENDDERLIQNNYLATHYIPADTIKKEYKKHYGRATDKRMSLADELEKDPRVKYIKKDNLFYVSYITDGEDIKSTISKSINHEIEGNKIIVHRAVVYLSNESSLGKYQIYNNPELIGEIIDEVDEESIDNYDIKVNEAAIYKFTFTVSIDGKYEFTKLEKVENY